MRIPMVQDCWESKGMAELGAARRTSPRMEQAIDNPDVYVGLEDTYVSLVGFQGE